MSDQAVWAYISPWMVESTELPPLRVGASVELAFEVRPVKRSLPVPTDAIGELLVVGASTTDPHTYLVTTPDASLGPVVLVDRGGTFSAGERLAGTWMLAPEVDVSNPLWSPLAVEQWRSALVRTRLLVRLQEADLQQTVLKYEDVQTTRTVGDGVGYRAQLSTSDPG